MRLALLAAATIAAFATAATAVIAQDDPIAARKALMKANGAAMGQLAPIAKGEKPFDAAVVMAALQKIDEDAKAMDVAKLFPAGSGEGDTRASPKIWEDMAGFQAAVDKFKADTAAALASNPQDQAGVGAAVGMIGANCGSCHEAWRINRS